MKKIIVGAVVLASIVTTASFTSIGTGAINDTRTADRPVIIIT